MYKYIAAPKKKYLEIGQSQSIKYALGYIPPGTMEFHEWFTPVKCRDFLLDTIYSKIGNKPVDIHQFKFDYVEVKENDEQLEMSIYCSPTNMDKILYNLHVLNKIEDENKFQRTEIHPTDNKEMFVVIGDRFWKTQSQYLSLYSWFFRLFLYMPIDNLETLAKSNSKATDIWTFQAIYKKLQVFLMNLRDYKSTDEDLWRARILRSPHNWHEESGIYGYLR